MTDLLDEDTTSGTPAALLGRDLDPVPRAASWAAATTQGMNRANNQDAFAQLGSVFAVADGMGGLADGRRAAELAVSAVVHGWQHFATATDVRNLFLSINHQVLGLAEIAGERVGTTLVSAHVEAGRVTIASVGDSRAYRLRRGALELLTRDHNLRGELLSAGISPSAEEVKGPLRSLTSYLGQEPQGLQIDVRSVGIVRGDRLLLCSDGVHGAFSHGDLSRIVSDGTPHECTQRLASANKAPGNDDATAVVVDISTPEDIWK